MTEQQNDIERLRNQVMPAYLFIFCIIVHLFAITIALLFVVFKIWLIDQDEDAYGDTVVMLFWTLMLYNHIYKLSKSFRERHDNIKALEELEILETIGT
jgi:hypothetical protein